MRLFIEGQEDSLDLLRVDVYRFLLEPIYLTNGKRYDLPSKRKNDIIINAIQSLTFLIN